MADLKKGYEIEGNRIEQMKRRTLCNFGTRPQAAIRNPRK